MGGLLPVVSSKQNGLAESNTGMYCRPEIDMPGDMNTQFSGFGRVSTQKNLPEQYGIIASFYTSTVGNYVAGQLFFAASGNIYCRIRWDNWLSWRKLG